MNAPVPFPSHADWLDLLSDAEGDRDRLAGLMAERGYADDASGAHEMIERREK